MVEVEDDGLLLIEDDEDGVLINVAHDDCCRDIIDDKLQDAEWRLKSHFVILDVIYDLDVDDVARVDDSKIEALWMNLFKLVRLKMSQGKWMELISCNLFCS